MPEGLVIRSYPAQGAHPVPASYGSGAWGYYIGCFFPVFAICLLGAAVFNGEKNSGWLFPAFLASMTALFLVVVCLKALKLEITTEGVSYTNPFRGTRSILFSDISAVVLMDYIQEGDGAASARRSFRRWTLVITPKVETCKPPIKIPLTLFSRDAYDDLVRLLKPEVWES